MALNYDEIADGAAATPDLWNDLFDALWKKDVFNVKRYGATGDGVTDDREAIQDAINAAGAVGGIVFFPPGTYKVTGTLYVTYDATNNASYPQGAQLQGAVKLLGVREMSISNFTNDVYCGSVIEYTGSSYAIDADGTSRSVQLRNFRLENLAIVANTSTQVLYVRNANQQSGFKGLLVVQEGASGSGVLWENTHTCTFDRSFIYTSQEGTNTGKGFVLRNTEDGTSGGMITLRDVTTRGFADGWQIGHETYGSGKALNNIILIGCQAKGGARGMLFAHGAKAIVGVGCHWEEYTTFGVQIRGNSGTVTLLGGYWDGPDATEADVVIGDSVLSGLAAGASNTLLHGGHFNRVASVGVRQYTSANIIGMEVVGCTFSPETDSVGTAIDLRTAAGATATNVHSVRLGPNKYGTFANTYLGETGADLIFEDGYMRQGRQKRKRRHSIASASALDVGQHSDVYSVTGTDTINTMTPYDGAEVTLILNAASTIAHNATAGSGKIRLRGGANITGGDKAVKLVCDGTNWFEV